jgi:hypothetical protein
MPERFLSEALKPVAARLDTTRMSRGEPGLPREFTWRGGTLRIARVREEWRETGPCHHGSGELYVRKHWYQAEDETGRQLKIYFERQSRGRQAKARWWLFSITDAKPASSAESPASD